ncbi:hypothetical protein [Gelidibacter maritimus]|uniref:CDP-Glycerol:Poly(Glycerophosphate) glycerophosphotransferase n=1 Tax=Gelidibacter maritimus TaxID=2761487 RepID=A0A7W2R3A2_9FLAO|nr:hypothetical protein [Gelidibacter maritimus]MBA6152651.1 hypothetical protein [Gelidibacter maritimus]
MKRSQEIEQDFGYQYLQYIEEIIEEYLFSIEKLNPNYLILNGMPIREMLGKRIFNKPLHDKNLRDLFNGYWRQGRIVDELKERFYYKTFQDFLFDESEFLAVPSDNSGKLEYKNIFKSFENELSPFKGNIVFYAYNKRFLDQVLPILLKLGEDIVVLTSYEFQESHTYPKSINIIEFSALKIEQDINEFLKLKFPILYYLYNTLELLIGILKPKSIIIMEGSSIIAYEMLALIGTKNNIKSICLQHGWPCVIHTGFRKMPFDYFLSWGDNFTALFKLVNPKPNFISTGYPFEVSYKNNIKKNSISFFFQAPYFISTTPIIEKMIDFAAFCANSFPDLDILIREHPANQYRNNKIDELKHFSNIKFVPSYIISLDAVLAKSIVSVAIFSSTLMESILYNSIPFIFNLTSMPNYYPNLQELDLGVEIKTFEEAKIRIKELLESETKIEDLRKNMSNCKSEYFLSTGNKAIETTANEILKISNRL